MLEGKRIVVVMPAYNAVATLEVTYREIPREIVDEVILVDDASSDDTAACAERLGIKTIVHSANRGYGGNQKTCYQSALEDGADIVIMLHPDYQYDPRLIPAIASMLVEGTSDVVLGSRILGGGALKGGMPLWKYVSNRFLTVFQNLCTGTTLSEYHTGYRAYTREVLTTVPWQRNSENFLFDNQMLAQILLLGFRVGEISCPAKYFPEASSINFSRSIRYGFGVLSTSLLSLLHRTGIVTSPLFTRQPPPHPQK